MKKFIDNYMSSITEEKSYKIQSFTYFIPAPKQFSQAYREKQFDKLFYDFINRGFKIIDIKTEQCSSPSGSGMWIIFIVQATNQEASQLKFEDIVDQNEIDLEKTNKNEDFEIIPE
jgi:hypothetical protein